MKDWAKFGFTRVRALFPNIKLGKPKANAQELIQNFRDAASAGASFVVTPELALTGYTCEDLFHSEGLIQETEEALFQILTATVNHQTIFVVGAPFRLVDGRYLNCAWVMQNGKVIGVIPKCSLPNMGEFYERRWFVSGRKVNETVNHPRLGTFLVSPFQIFAAGPARLGIEICQDLWTPNEPSSYLALKGANLILNLSASNETLGKAEFRRKLVTVQSSKQQCAYLYVSSGTYESSKDTVFGGHALACELGTILDERKPFHTDTDLTIDFDLESVLNSRTKDICFLETVEDVGAFKGVIHSLASPVTRLEKLERAVEPYPFLAEVSDCNEVIQIQVQGLLRRAQSSGAKSLVIGISGGLDSTHALAVALKTRALSNGTLQVIGVTLPGPGTSDQTLALARTLLIETQVDRILEISITDSVNLHLKELGKSNSDRGVVYENAQARERTQVLFDLANEHQGLVVGTGDLSELALGWCTFNADQMAHYAVNSGIPKTVIKALVAYWAQHAETPTLGAALEKVIELPISPELLPPSETGAIVQDTEALIGSYDLHDFFLYQFLYHGFSREKISALAEVAFANQPLLLAKMPETLERFYSRFFSQQFKRTTLPPGPKIHRVSLSPRSDFRLPDEISR